MNDEIAEMLKECQLQVRQEIQTVDRKNADKIEELQREVVDLEKKLISLDTLIPMMKESLDGTTQSNKELSVTLVTISNTIQNLSDKQEDANKKLTSLSNKVDVLEKQGNFNWINFVQKNFLSIVIILFLVVFLIGQIMPQFKINLPLS